jgi:hypothetical protein
MSALRKEYPKQVVNIADAMNRVMTNGFQEAPASVKAAASNECYQFDLAAVGFQSSAKRLGMGPEMTASALEKARVSMHRVCGVCDSPIEKALVPWLILANYDPFLTAPARVHLVKEDKLPPVADVLIIPQFTFARFRFDFAVVGEWRGSSRIVAVECDGQDYHGRAADDVRDRYLAAFNITTIRATGSDAYHNPGRVAARVAQTLSTWAAQ